MPEEPDGRVITVRLEEGNDFIVHLAHDQELAPRQSQFTPRTGKIENPLPQADHPHEEDTETIPSPSLLPPHTH